MIENQISGIRDCQLIQLFGKDCKRFLNNFCTAKVDDLQTGDVIEGFILDVKGKVLTLASIFFDDQSLYLLSIGKPQSDVIKHLDHYLITEDVELSIVENAKLFWVESAPPKNCQLENVEHKSALPFLKSCSEIDLPGKSKDKKGWLMDSNFSPGSKVLLTVGLEPVEHETVFKQGNRKLGISEDFSRLRIVNRFPLVGAEIDPGVLPQELDRDQASINFRKGCYLGQETVARLDAMGSVNWKTVLFQTKSIPDSLSSEVCRETGVIPSKWESRQGQKVVGKLTSIARMPGNNGWVGLARIRTKLQQNESSWVFENEGTEHKIEVFFSSATV